MASANGIDFVHTGPGSVAGRYLRRFWQPVYRAEDLAHGKMVPIQIMSERFTLFRGEGGTAHLVDFRCAHRGTQLSTGWVEGDSVRCRYHGWRYEGSGQCVEQPGEEEAFAQKIKIRSYPAQEYLGLIFAYLGEGKPPPLRRYAALEGDGVLEVYTPEYWPCNYFNRIDNACDVGHVRFAHRESREAVGQALETPVLSAEETGYGVRTSVVQGGKLVATLHFHMPNTNHFRTYLAIRDPASGFSSDYLDRLLIRVPVDDEHCVSFPLDFAHLSGEAARKYQERRQRARQATKDSHTDLGEEILAGKLRMCEVTEQANLKNLTSLEDYIVQVGQGGIPDRDEERLGRMDVGVILLRKLWERELEALVEGKPLKEWKVPENLGDTGQV
ncbi:MAG TPA: Rieske 2Fe-2S domain-containing protein [Candidatus Binatia bacterium]